MHRNRSAEPDQCNLYLEFDHGGYPVAKQCERCVDNQRPDRNEKGLYVPARHLIFYVSAGVAEPEDACLDDSNPGQMAEYLMTEFVQDDTREGERSD